MFDVRLRFSIGSVPKGTIVTVLEQVDLGIMSARSDCYDLVLRAGRRLTMVNIFRDLEYLP